MKTDPRSWAEALLGFHSKQEIVEQRALALESASMAGYGHYNPRAIFAARYLDDPSVDKKSKVEVLASMLPGDETWSAFCEALVRARACTLIPRIAREFRAALDRSTGTERVRIESPRPLDKSSRESVLEAWSAISKAQKIIHSEAIVPELLGGFRFSAGSIRYDVSIAGKLRQLRSFLGHALPRTTAQGEGL